MDIISISKFMTRMLVKVNEQDSQPKSSDEEARYLWRTERDIAIPRAFGTADGQTYSEMDTLLGHLFNESRYNKFLRPLQNQSQVIKVNFTQFLSSIDYFDISTGELLITGFFDITWTDEFLTWDPSVYGGKEFISLPKGKFWKPEISLTNGPANKESSIYNSGLSPTLASNKGSVIMIPGGSYKTKCKVDTTFYPNDIHICNFQFIVTNHYSSELILYSPTADIHIEDFEENGEWEIENTNAKVVLLKEENVGRMSIAMLQASFSLKRRPAFEIINIYTPITLMSFLNIVTCFVRPNSGERLAFAVTLYLSLVFATTAAIENIPSNSLKIPYLSYEFLCNNFINTVSVTWSIFIASLSSKSITHQRLPIFLIKMIIKKRQGKTCKSDLQPDGKFEVKSEPPENEEVSEEIKAKQKQSRIASYAPVNDITGLEVAETLDTIYFWSILFFLSVLNTTFGALLFRIWTK